MTARPLAALLPDDVIPRLWDVLKAHQPTTDTERRVHTCACGLKFNFIDARAWQRHATAMVLNLLGEVPVAAAARATPDGEPCHPVRSVADDKLLCQRCGLVSNDGGMRWYDDGGERP